MFSDLVFFQLMLQQLLPHVSKANYKCCSSMFTIQCFGVKIQMFHTHLLHVVFAIFSQHFFCAHRHDCGLYTMLYMESWNGKKMETTLQPVIAATY
jgi:hypothetical protein